MGLILKFRGYSSILIGSNFWFGLLSVTAEEVSKTLQTLTASLRSLSSLAEPWSRPHFLYSNWR